VTGLSSAGASLLSSRREAFSPPQRSILACGAMGSWSRQIPPAACLVIRRQPTLLKPSGPLTSNTPPPRRDFGELDYASPKWSMLSRRSHFEFVRSLKILGTRFRFLLR
jgi:hypothetical protein